MLSANDAALIHDLLNGFLATGFLSAVGLIGWAIGYSAWSGFKWVRRK
jgi:hypothetical protein